MRKDTSKDDTRNPVGSGTTLYRASFCRMLHFLQCSNLQSLIFYLTSYFKRIIYKSIVVEYRLKNLEEEPIFSFIVKK